MVTCGPIPGATVGSLLAFASPNGDEIKGVRAIVLSVLETGIQATVASPLSARPLQSGFWCFLAEDSLSIAVSPELLGYALDPLGNQIAAISEESPRFSGQTFNLLIERPAPGIIDRSSVSRPLATGTKIVDTLFPIGKGQRELIIGDRQTGKTTLAVDSILCQYRQGESFSDGRSGVVSIYVAIGQKNSTVHNLLDQFLRLRSTSATAVVCASAADSATFQYLAPYSGCSVGEFFRDLGFDALVVYDDLSKHATAYRQLSLILRRPPGREAYPGDVFYLHSRLLERAAQLSSFLGGGSLTALPVVETQAGDISSYIPTNVISITDGQIFLESDLFYQGVRPAVNVGLSVSRVGSKAQVPPLRALSAYFKSDMAQYRESLSFARFGSDLDSETRALLERGGRYVELFKQSGQDPYTVEELIVVLLAASDGLFGEIDVGDVVTVERSLVKLIREETILFKPLLPHLVEDYIRLAPLVLAILREIFTAWSSQLRRS